jgi:hypothetical protein
MLADVIFHRLHIGCHHFKALRQRFNVFKTGWTFRIAPSASRMVSLNFAGKAVSSTIIGTPVSICSSATLMPSAVCVSIVMP